MTPCPVVVATDLADDGLELLRRATDVSPKHARPGESNLRQLLEAAEGLIVRSDVQVDAELLEHAPRLRVIGLAGTGVGNIDVDTATRRGIIVTSTPGAGAIAAGEHTLALLLALGRNLVPAHNSLQAGYWPLQRARQAGVQLAGKTIGIVGYGRVGRVVAERCLAFGMQVLVHDPYIAEDQPGDRRLQPVGLDDLLGRSDFISLHVPLTDETRQMLDAAAIERIRPGARLINTAHGAVWDEQAVADALRSGQLAGVATDVFPQEPPSGSPLIGLDAVLHTPRIGDNTREANLNLSTRIVAQVLDALRGHDYRHVVNMPFLPGAPWAEARPYMRLADCMGRILHALARQPVRRVAVEYRGERLDDLIKPLTVALLHGILKPVLGDQVNYINAPVLASVRGLQVMQTRGLSTGDYASLVSCHFTLEGGEEITMGGTLLDGREPRIVQINEYDINFVPLGQLLIMGSRDQPGVIGRVGTLLADNDVNIASWQTGRASPGGNTLTVLTLDQPLTEGQLRVLQALEFVRHARQLEIRL
ncbi:MAG: phosphoglycerate dehydrogenase [Anaerolineaceae bacterium]|nr:phosphoglycerate dehydrogenase [Anaerolineaceae bacterium]